MHTGNIFYQNKNFFLPTDPNICKEFFEEATRNTHIISFGRSKYSSEDLGLIYILLRDCETPILVISVVSEADEGKVVSGECLRNRECFGGRIFFFDFIEVAGVGVTRQLGDDWWDGWTLENYKYWWKFISAFII